MRKLNAQDIWVYENSVDKYTQKIGGKYFSAMFNGENEFLFILYALWVNIRYLLCILFRLAVCTRRNLFRTNK